MEEWDDAILSDLSDSEFDLPPLEFEESDEGECDDSDEVGLDEAIISTIKKKKPIEVLIDVGNDRRKIITLNDGNENLEQTFLESIKGDKEFEKHVNSTVVFQIFNEKFKTWVDLDKGRPIHDGIHLKALFREKSRTHRQSKKSHKHKKSRKRRRSSSSSDNERNFHEHHYSRKHTCSLAYEISNVESSTNYLEQLPYSDDGNKEMTATPAFFYDYGRSDCGDGTWSGEHNKEKLELVDTTPEMQNPQTNDVVQDPSPVSTGELYCLSLGLSDKNPISALHELCSRLHWGTPVFELETQSVHNVDPQFLMKVTVKGHTYIPDLPSRKKQLAKTAAAELCLKKLGILK